MLSSHLLSVSPLNMLVLYPGYGRMASFTLSSFWSQQSASHATLHGNSTSHVHDSNCCPFSLCLIIIFSYGRTYRPSSYHIAQELQKYNIPDYRPRQEQYARKLSVIFWLVLSDFYRFQKAIKKVRAVQRMRRNRGFAFSQTENGRQDQAKLIRAYDTSKSNARPSGY